MAALALCLTLSNGLGSGPSSAKAQEVYVSGPLAGAPAVKKLRLWRDMRLHVEPFFAFTIADEYARSLIVGGEARFHFLDWLGIGGWGGYTVGKLNTNLTGEVQSSDAPITNANRLDLPTHQNFPDQIGRLNWWSGVEMHFVPFRGKLAMFQKVFFDADLDFFAGVAFVGVEERANAVGLPSRGDVTDCLIGGSSTLDQGCTGSQLARSKRTAIAPSFGVAFSAFFKEFLGIALRWRGIPFKYNTGGTDNNDDGQINSQDRIRQFNNMFTVGIIFVLPPKTKTSD
ncbi:MAG: hypothetical protein PVH21_10545 [Myxococcales bacterium]